MIGIKTSEFGKNIDFQTLRSQRGITMIEVLISLAILAIGLLAVAKMQLATVHNTTNGNVITQATLIANRQLERIKSVDDIADLDDASNPLLQDTRYDEQGNQDANGLYRLSTTVIPLTITNTSGGTEDVDEARNVTITVSWSRIWSNRQVTLNTITQGNGV